MRLKFLFDIFHISQNYKMKGKAIYHANLPDNLTLIFNGFSVQLALIDY